MSKILFLAFQRHVLLPSGFVATLLPCHSSKNGHCTHLQNGKLLETKHPWLLSCGYVLWGLLCHSASGKHMLTAKPAGVFPLTHRTYFYPCCYHVLFAVWNTWHHSWLATDLWPEALPREPPLVCVLCYGSRSSIVAAVASASLCCLQKDTNGLQRNHMSVAFVCFHPRSALHPMYLLSLPRPTLFEVSCQRNLHHLEVLYHIRPYFVGIFPYIGLTNRPYIW